MSLVFPFRAAVVALRVCGAETEGQGLRVGAGQLRRRPCPAPRPLGGYPT